MKINKKLDNLLRKQGFEKIALKKYKTGHIVFELILNQNPVKFLLDTGASETILTFKCAENLSLKMEDTEELGTGTNSSQIKMKKTRVDHLIIGKKTISDIHFFIMNLSHINDSLIELGHSSIQGILGADILHKYNCVIDYKGCNLYIGETF